MSNDTHVTWHEHQVTRERREALHGHRGCVIWFTGLSGSGKSTIANTLDHRLHGLGLHSAVLDGDNVRHGLNAGPAMLRDTHGPDFASRFGLGFSAIDREENIRRIGEVAKLFTQAGVIALTAFISPYRADRDKARELLNDGEFVEVYLKCAVDVCESRDVKGLYKKARAGEIKEFTGISAPYEEPLNPELVIDTAAETLEESTRKVLAYLQSREIIG